MMMYNIEDKVVLWLSGFEFVTYKKFQRMLEAFDDFADLFENIRGYRSKLLDIFNTDEYSQLLDNNNFSQTDRVLLEYEKLGIGIITILNTDYPEILKQIDTPSIILYYKGDISLLKTDCLGVVGTRRATAYGKSIGSKIVKEIAHEGITIVSGLAEGIDTVAHKSTLEVKGKTIAILGSGLLNIYPASNTQLSNDIVSNGGLILSEYKPSEPTVTYHFPVRNRIIAGLCKAVLIVEATEKSGSMHTKNYAIEYNREVFAVPARINDVYSAGCNRIIANGQARMLLNSGEIIDFFGKSIDKVKQTKSVQLTCEEQMIYDTLDLGEHTFDEIAVITKMQAGVLSTMLMRLEIKGIIRRLPGNLYTIER